MLPTKPPVLRQAGYLFARLDHLAEAGVTFEDVCNPDYWAPVMPELAVNHVINVVAADGSFECELRVVNIGPSTSQAKLWAETRVMRVWQSDATAAPAEIGDVDADDFKISFSSADGEKHRIIAVKTGAVIAKGIRTRAEAVEAGGRLRAERQRASQQAA